MLGRIEKYLIRWAVVSLLLVVVAQGLMTADPIRFYMSWSERMEGQSLPAPVNASKIESSSVNSPALKSPDALISLASGNNVVLPQAKILLNGKPRYAFSRSPVTIKVEAGDTVEIDASSYNIPIEFTISSVSDNIGFPVKGDVFAANQSIVMIGKVIVK